jgi:hypothetical protein
MAENVTVRNSVRKFRIGVRYFRYVLRTVEASAANECTSALGDIID